MIAGNVHDFAATAGSNDDVLVIAEDNFATIARPLWSIWSRAASTLNTIMILVRIISGYKKKLE